MTISLEKEASILAPLHKSLIEEKEAQAQSKKAIEETLLLIKPDAIHHHGGILTVIDRNGFAIESTSMVLTKGMAQRFAYTYETTETDSSKIEEWYEQNVDHLLSGTVMAVLLSRVHAVSALLQLLGPSDPLIAKKKSPNSIRALFGTSELRNAVSASTNTDQARKDIILTMGYAPTVGSDYSEEEGCGSDRDGYNKMTTKELRELAKQQLREVTEERTRLENEREEMIKREQRDINSKLYPNGNSPLKLAMGSLDVFDSSSRIMRHCQSIDTSGTPLVPEDLRQVFDSLDTTKIGFITRKSFKQLYDSTPAFENYGVPKDEETLNKQLEQHSERGISFDEFCLLFYKLARR